MSSTRNPIHRLFGMDVSAHGDNTTATLNKTQNLEVISLGLSRTGTTSMQFALPKLGYGLCHGGIDSFRSIDRTNAFVDIYTKIVKGVWKADDPALTARLREMFRGYRSVTDLPVWPIPEEMFTAFPHAKYILTVRPGGKEEWWRSYSDAGYWHYTSGFARTWFRFLIYPSTILRRTDDTVQLVREMWEQSYGGTRAECYDLHNERVKRIIPKEQLLVYDVRQGWEPLCKFLSKPVPNEPFPRLNDAQAMRALYIGFMSYGAFLWAFHIGSAVVVGYLAMNPEVAKGVFATAVGFATQAASKAGLK